MTRQQRQSVSSALMNVVLLSLDWTLEDKWKKSPPATSIGPGAVLIFFSGAETNRFFRLHVHSILFWSFSLRVESTAFTSRTGPKEPPLFRFTFELHEQSPAHLVTVATTDKLENETH